MGITYSTIKDVEEINILKDRQSFDYTYDQATIELLKINYLIKDSLYILANDGKEFVAFCSVDRDWWENNYFFIREILVSPKFQRQNIGKILMNKCIDYARNKNAIGVVTETAFNNVPMQKLCSSIGFDKWVNPKWKTGITYKLIF